MVYYRLILILAAAGFFLIGSRCSPTPPQVPEPIWPQNKEQVSKSESSDNSTDFNYVIYTNRAAGYNILRPANWYWRHYIANEIKKYNPQVVDYFITDPQPLPGLDSEYLGQIVIEISERPLVDYQGAVSGLFKTEAVVANQSAYRFAGERVGMSGEKKYLIEYQLEYNNKTYRLVCKAKTANDSAVEIFEHMVKSLKF